MANEDESGPNSAEATIVIGFLRLNIGERARKTVICFISLQKRSRIFAPRKQGPIPADSGSPLHQLNLSFMGLQAGIVGLPDVGKSTLFNAVSNSAKGAGRK